MVVNPFIMDVITSHTAFILNGYISMRALYLSLLLVHLSFTAPSGTPYCTLANPSFEDPNPREARFPEGWSSQTPNNTPDLLPGAWGLQAAPFHGNTCLGLVTRDDGGVENVGQRLSNPLRPLECYTLSLHLCKAAQYVGYHQPCRLRIWGGSQPGSKQVLLATSTLVSHTDWRKYEFTFTPKVPVESLTFEAYYAPGASFKYKGNILLDHCSAIEKCVKA